LTRCSICHKGLNSSYIRLGSCGSLKKIGMYCSTCNLHYNLDQKLYTVNEKLYTVSNNINSQDKESANDNKIVNLPTNLCNHINSTKLNRNKLYNCQQDTYQTKIRRVRSVVRISRRSSEPQVMGSKPTGPVTIKALLRGFYHNMVYKKSGRNSTSNK
jgi:hypothetical protein